jgi:hypothetical protein
MSIFRSTWPCDLANKRAHRGVWATLAIGLSFLLSPAAPPAPAEGFEINLPADPRNVSVKTVVGEIVVVPGRDREMELRLQKMMEIIEAQRRELVAPGLAAPLEPPLNAPRARFDLLPNWDRAKSAAFLLPNFEAGTVQFLLIDASRQVTSPEVRTVTLEPDGGRIAVERP